MFQILKVATNEPSTLHLTICTWIVLENYNNNDQQVNRHFIFIYLKIRITTFNVQKLLCLYMRAVSASIEWIFTCIR